MDSSATVKVRLRKGAGMSDAAAAARLLAAFRERILCCGRKINNGRAEPFVEQAGEAYRSSFSSFFFSLSAAAAAADFPRSTPPPTPRSHFLFARQINPPPRRNPPSLTGTSRCSRVPSFSSFHPRALSFSRAPIVDRSIL